MWLISRERKASELLTYCSFELLSRRPFSLRFSVSRRDGNLGENGYLPGSLCGSEKWKEMSWEKPTSVNWRLILPNGELPSRSWPRHPVPALPPLSPWQ